MTAAVQPDLFTGPQPAPTPRQIGQQEQALRDAALERLEALRADWLARIRQAMRLLYAERQEAIARDGHWAGPQGPEPRPWVSADDARLWFEAQRDRADLNRNFLGGTFRGHGWHPLIGRRILSTTAGSHANELKVWIYHPHERSTA